MYNWFARFWHNVERQRERELYADVHVMLYELGFTHQVSFYGTTIRPYDGFHYQARIEVVSRDELTPIQFSKIYSLLDGFMPDCEYTFLALHDGELVGMKVR